MRPLRFCMLTTFYPPFNFGGDGVAVQNLARALVARGHQVTVVHDVDAFRVLSGKEPPVEGPDDGVEVVRLRSRLPVLSSLLTQQIGRPVVQGGELQRLLGGRRFDVIHYHNISLVGGPGLLSLGSAAKLYTAHEHWLVCPTHVLWRNGREACTEKQCLRCMARYRRPPQLWRYTGYLERQLAHVDAFIAQSDFSRNKHMEFGFPREMEVIPQFLPAGEPRRNRADERPPHPRPFFLFMGRLERIKGVHEILPLFRGEGPADLLVAGEGTEGPALRATAADSPRVRFLGRVSPEALRGYLRHAVGLLVPSAGFETFGLVVIEAFREGTPVIARRLGPSVELVEACGGGVLFDSTAEIADAMQRLLDEPEYRRALSRAGLEGFRKWWSEDGVVPRYLELAQKILETRGGAAGPRLREAPV